LQDTRGVVPDLERSLFVLGGRLVLLEIGRVVGVMLDDRLMAARSWRSSQNLEEVCRHHQVVAEHLG